MGKNFDQLPAATSLTGTETIPVNQAGVTVKTTTQAIANLAPPPVPVQTVYIGSDARLVSIAGGVKLQVSADGVTWQDTNSFVAS